MRAFSGAMLALVAIARVAAAQDEAALRAAFEGKIVVARIDMPATSRGVDVYPLDPTPVNFRDVARRLKDNGTGVRIGQQMMVTKVVVKKNSHVEFQLGGGGYGTFSDWTGSDVHVVAAGETKEERALRESIKRTVDKNERRRLERELNALRSARERENARAAAEAQQANLARETSVRARRAESGSRFNIRYHEGIPPEGLTPEGVRRALAQYVEFPDAPLAGPAAGVPAGAGLSSGADPRSGQPAGAAGISALRKGQTVQEVEALLGSATTSVDVREGSITVTKRTYRQGGVQVAASFVSGVLIDYSITPR